MWKMLESENEESVKALVLSLTDNELDILLGFIELVRRE